MYPLLLFIALIVGGSLYPWHFAAATAAPWLILIRSWSREWAGIQVTDAAANIVVYIPLGAITFWTAARRYSPQSAAAKAILLGLFLSLGMELLQAYVPGRTSSLVDLAFNVVGASIGALVAWPFRNVGRLVPPFLLLVCWACYHLYPPLLMISFARIPLELGMWLHPQSVSFIEIWSYAAEWLAVGVAVRQLFGRPGLRWLPMVFVFHFVTRPFIPARPLVLEDLLGMILALLLWKALPEKVRSGPSLLISMVLLRECAPLPWYPLPPPSWIPFQVFLSTTRGAAIVYLARATFDYAAILWLWRNRRVPYEKSGAILTGTLAVLVVMQRYLHLPGDALSMTDPVLALLMAVMFGAGNRPRPRSIEISAPAPPLRSPVSTR